jgi:hypothetical protein
MLREEDGANESVFACPVIFAPEKNCEVFVRIFFQRGRFCSTETSGGGEILP